MKLWWRKLRKRVASVDRGADDTDRRLAESKRAAELSQRALDKVEARAPRVQAHQTSIRHVAEDNGLAGIILYGFRGRT